MPNQLTLPIDRPHEQRLENFVPGPNAELVALLRESTSQFRGIWLTGPLHSGRSHLLRATCVFHGRDSVPVAYIGCEDFTHDRDGLQLSLGHASRYARVVAVDDIDVVAGDPDMEEALLAVYQRVFDLGGLLVFSHTAPAVDLSFQLEDLNSRMRSLMHFQMMPLDDTDKATILKQRADARGYALTEPVLNYWLARGPRDVTSLLMDLDTLDRASLVYKQTVTIPLLKQVLGY